MTDKEQALENQPTPEEVAEAKRRYMREYMKKRRNDPALKEKLKEQNRNYSREYMRAYSKTPEYQAQHLANQRERMRAKSATLEELAVTNPKKYARTLEKKNKKQNVYLREYSQRPEVKERRKELAAQQPEEVKQRIKEQSRERAKIARIAKANGIDTETVRNVLAQYAPAPDKVA
jgi:hypothetical protein